MERLFEKKTPEANELPDDMPEVVQVTGEEVKLRKKQRRSINSPVRYSSKSQ